MKRRINIQFIIITIIAILTTMGLMVWILYNVFREQVLDGLRLEAEVLKNSYVFAREKIDSEEIA